MQGAFGTEQSFGREESMRGSGVGSSHSDRAGKSAKAGPRSP